MSVKCAMKKTINDKKKHFKQISLPSISCEKTPIGAYYVVRVVVGSEYWNAVSQDVLRQCIAIKRVFVSQVRDRI